MPQPTVGKPLFPGPTWFSGHRVGVIIGSHQEGVFKKVKTNQWLSRDKKRRLTNLQMSNLDAHWLVGSLPEEQLREIQKGRRTRSS